jgi:hypothetical protein
MDSDPASPRQCSAFRAACDHTAPNAGKPHDQLPTGIVPFESTGWQSMD